MLLVELCKVPGWYILHDWRHKGFQNEVFPHTETEGWILQTYHGKYQPVVGRFLDMHVSKGGRHGTSGLLEIGSYKKPSSQKVPLHSTSAHHQSVHKSWPLCRLNHFENITTSYEGCMKAKTEFVIELVNKAAGHAALPLVFQQIAGETGVIARESKPCSWLVLPFHIAYEGERLHDILLSYRDTWPTAYAHLFPRIAWRLIEPSIQSRMQRHLQPQP